MNTIESHIDKRPELYNEYLSRYGEYVFNLLKNSTIPSLEFKNIVEIKDINDIKDMCVYAKMDIPAGSLITRYPCYFLTEDNGEINYNKNVLFQPIFQSNNGRNYFQMMSEKLYKPYQLEKKQIFSLDEESFQEYNNRLSSNIMNDFRKRSLFEKIIPHPFIYNDPEFLAHLIKDSVDFNDFNYNLFNYIEQSNVSANSFITELGAIAIKPIKCGEKITASLGVHYHLRQNDIDIDEIITPKIIDKIIYHNLPKI